MKESLKKFKGSIKIVIIIFSLLLIVSFLNLFSILGTLPSAIINMIIGVFVFFVVGVSRGLKRDNKGYIGGLITGFIMIVVMFLISLIVFRVQINLMMFIYYLILLVSCVLGSMVGINRKKDNK